MDQLGGMREDMKGVVVQIGIGRVHLSLGDELISTPPHPSGTTHTQH